MVTDRPGELELVGGNVALDLANTVEGPRGTEPEHDHIPDDAALVEWAVHASTADDPKLPVPPGTLDRVHGLRAAIYDVFEALASGREPHAAALAELTAIHAQALAGARLVRRGEGFDYDLDLVLTPAQAALDLLRHGPLDRLKMCDNCRWLFLDVSRNRSRRWCTMRECGTHVKMRRYRARRRYGRSTTM